MRINKFYIVCGFLFGILVGFLSTRYCFFEFDPEINLVDLLNLIVTVVLAIYVALFLQKKQGQDGAEKEIIISELKELKSENSILYDYVISGNLNINDTVRKFKTISVRLNSIKDLYRVCDISNSNNLAEIKNKLLDNKQLITGSPVVNNMLAITPTHRSSYGQVSWKINKLITEEIISINRK
jgi:hypothetical protein